MMKISSLLKRSNVVPALQEALEKNQLKLRYQPIINTQTNRVMSLEALLSWPKIRDYELTIEALFAVLEQDEVLSSNLDRSLIEIAFIDYQKYFSKLDTEIGLSINTCPSTLSSRQFSCYLKLLLDKYGIDGNKVVLELTERSIWLNRHNTEANLDHLREMGVKIAIDDFITGYANFSALLHRDTDTIKLDRTVTQKIPEDELYCRFCRSFAELAHQVDKKVIVEGIETKDQFDFFRDAGYYQFQGYYIAKPVSADQVAQVIEQLEHGLLISS